MDDACDVNDLKTTVAVHAQRHLTIDRRLDSHEALLERLTVAIQNSVNSTERIMAEVRREAVVANSDIKSQISVLAVKFGFGAAIFLAVLQVAMKYLLP